MKENWKPINEFNGEYEVSNLGRIRKAKVIFDGYIGKIHYVTTKEKSKILHINQNSHGYNRVCIKGKYYRVAILVAKAFVQNPENKPEIDHINTIRTDDRASNLRWVTHKENMLNPLTRKKRLKVVYKTRGAQHVYVYDTTKSKKGRCVMDFCGIRTTARYFCVSYSKIKNAIDNPNKRINGYLLKSERKRYLTKQ